MCMPETKGRDLQAIGESFGLHSAADMPVIRGLRTLGSWGRKVVGGGGGSRRMTEVENQGIKLERRL